MNTVQISNSETAHALYLLSLLESSLGVDAALIYRLQQDGPRLVAALHLPDAAPMLQQAASYHPHRQRLLTPPDALLEEGFGAGLLLPLVLDAQPIGALLLLRRAADPFSADSLEAQRPVFDLLETVLQHAVLHQQNAVRRQSVLSEGSHLLAALTPHISDALLLVLPQGQVLAFNQRFTEWFHVPSSAQGLHLDELLELMALPRSARADLADAWSQPALDSGELLLPTPGGAQDLIWHQTVLQHETAVLGRLFTFSDVTPSRAAARMRAAFLSRLTHELRTPLTSIYGFAQFILEATGDDLPDLAREYTEIIRRSARHLNGVFNSIVEIVRADVGELQLHLTPAHLPDLIIDVVARQELDYKPRQQKVLLDLDDDLPSVLVDVTRVQQVFSELLTNAIKFSPEGATIRVVCQHAQDVTALPEALALEMRVPCALITVLDSGVGISEEEAAQIFQPFYRGKTVGTVEGSGLGLTIALSITELHGGRLWVEPSSKKRPGGCFRLALPYA